MTTLNILMAQMNTLVGDFTGNTTRVLQSIEQVQGAQGTTVLVFPELTLSGYPPEDLLLRPSVERRVGQSLDRILAAVQGNVYVVIGYPRRDKGNKVRLSVNTVSRNCQITRFLTKSATSAQVMGPAL